jgi:hypothetical protein
MTVKQATARRLRLRREVLTNTQRQNLATAFLVPIADQLGVPVTVLGNERLSVTLEADVYQFEFTYFVGTGGDVAAAIAFEQGLASTAVTVTFNGATFTANPGATTTVASDVTETTAKPDGGSGSAAASDDERAATASAIVIGVLFVMLLVVVAVLLVRNNRASAASGPTDNKKTFEDYHEGVIHDVTGGSKKTQLWWDNRAGAGALDSGEGTHYHPAAADASVPAVPAQSSDNAQINHFYPASSGWNPTVRLGAGALPAATGPATQPAVVPRGEQADGGNQWSVWVAGKPSDGTTKDGNDDIGQPDSGDRPASSLHRNAIFDKAVRRQANGYLDTGAPADNGDDPLPSRPRAADAVPLVDDNDDFEIVDSVLKDLLLEADMGTADVDSSDDDEGYLRTQTPEPEPPLTQYQQPSAFPAKPTGEVRHHIFSDSDDDDVW